jgi:hypothetical protein
MTDKKTCKCGAVYKVGSLKLTVRDRDHFDCRVCGARLDDWNASRIPTYELIEQPDGG